MLGLLVVWGALGGCRALWLEFSEAQDDDLQSSLHLPRWVLLFIFVLVASLGLRSATDLKAACGRKIFQSEDIEEMEAVFL